MIVASLGAVVVIVAYCVRVRYPRSALTCLGCSRACLLLTPVAPRDYSPPPVHHRTHRACHSFHTLQARSSLRRLSASSLRNRRTQPPLQPITRYQSRETQDQRQSLGGVIFKRILSTMAHTTRTKDCDDTLDPSARKWPHLATDVQKPKECVARCRSRFIAEVASVPDDDEGALCAALSRRAGVDRDMGWLYCCDSVLCGVWFDGVEGSTGQDREFPDVSLCLS